MEVGHGARSRPRHAALVALVCVLTVLGVPPGADGATLGQVRGQLIVLRLNPPPLFPSTLPVAFRGAAVTLYRDADFDVEFDRNNPQGFNVFAVTFKRDDFPALDQLVNDPGVYSRRHVRIGARTVWLLLTGHAAAPALLAWHEQGRTYMLLEKYAGAKQALATLSPFVLSLRLLTSPPPPVNGQAIVDATASQANLPYCWFGGNEAAPTHGAGNTHGATQCPGQTVGFDCTGLTQYAAYKGTGARVDLTHHDAHQAQYAPGPWITSEQALLPGDIVYFGSSRNDINHSAVYAGVLGGKQMIWDADTAFWKYADGVHERELASENNLHFVGAARVWQQ
jgi:cell wall-associated NlpC family hydrolase